MAVYKGGTGSGCEMGIATLVVQAFCRRVVSGWLGTYIRSVADSIGDRVSQP